MPNEPNMFMFSIDNATFVLHFKGSLDGETCSLCNKGAHWRMIVIFHLENCALYTVKNVP